MREGGLSCRILGRCTGGRIGQSHDEFNIRRARDALIIIALPFFRQHFVHFPFFLNEWLTLFSSIMPSPYDSRADNVPDWIWHNRTELGVGEIIPTSDVDEIELEARVSSKYSHKYLILALF